MYFCSFFIYIYLYVYIVKNRLVSHVLKIRFNKLYYTMLKKNINWGMGY